MNRFVMGIGWRVVVLLGVAMATGYAVWGPYPRLLPVLGGVVGLLLAANLYLYCTNTNRKLIRFLESVQYSDFAISFRSDNTLGPTFRDLNGQFNTVLEAFRQARAEKEANLHYLNTLVQHVNVGLLSFESSGRVELVNQTALRLLGVYRLRTLADLQATQPDLHSWLLANAGAAVATYQGGPQGELTVRCTSVRLRGRLVSVISLQNIRSELQQKELESWQNLTKVLRHEIMNSITPIVSLTGTMRDIIEVDLLGKDDAPAEDLSPTALGALNDLRDALSTIENRGQSIMRFVDAYRSFTSIPQPKLTEVSARELLMGVANLAQPDLNREGVKLTVVVPSPVPMLLADAGQVEMILLNLLRNALESFAKPTPGAAIRLEASVVDTHTILAVIDNGPGIEPEAIEQIFIPFYTTKKTGSGIGLSLSRQIMQQHGGSLTVASEPGKGSTFRLVF
ncbi:sensor histidine kinase [Rudanella lutea]|uniref:sensor histidine kinase n=1 Tax=Rudanella lutea TaxID=451374 RepID=UPI00035E1EE8|nr:HAMP domain-containing sensor histidine kinase [Rudanella lutea]